MISHVRHLDQSNCLPVKWKKPSSEKPSVGKTSIHVATDHIQISDVSEDTVHQSKDALYRSEACHVMPEGWHIKRQIDAISFS